MNTFDQPKQEETAVAETIAHCKTCQTPLMGKYCYVCGQRTMPKRFTLKTSMNSFLSVITNMDRGLWHTMIWMFTKPHVVLEDALKGATARYFHPFRYLFLFLTIQVFLMVSVIDMEGMTAGMYPTDENPATVAMQRQFIHAIYSYNHIFITLTLPLLALAYWWVFGVKRFTYGEQLIITAYSYGHSVLIGIVVSLLYLTDLSFMLVSFLSMPLVVLYLFYVNMRFFKGHWLKVLLKTIGAFVVYTLFIGVISAALGIAFVVFKAATDPQFMEQFKQASPTT
jgi:hypothetical protein